MKKVGVWKKDKEPYLGSYHYKVTGSVFVLKPLLEGHNTDVEYGSYRFAKADGWEKVGHVHIPSKSETDRKSLTKREILERVVWIEDGE